MAVVGSAEIIVRAITTGVKKDIQDGFKGLAGDTERAGQDVSKSFNKGMNKSPIGGKFLKEADAYGKKFHGIIRSTYKLQAGAGALIQTISTLGVGIAALGGNMLGAASSGVALVGLMAQMKVATLVAKQAFNGVSQAVAAAGAQNSATGKTVKELREEMQQLAFEAEGAALSEEKAALNLEKARETLSRVQNLPPDNRARREAELAYQEADLAYRKAKDNAADLQDKIANPPKAKGGGNDPYKDLTATQKVFAQYLASVQPKMKQLREAAASSFLPVLTEQMKIMFAGGYFDMLVKGFEDVSKGLGEATRQFAGTIFDPKNKANMADFFKASGKSVGTLGGALGNAFGGFLTLMKAIDPLITRFAQFLASKADSFASNMSNNFASVSTFFRQAGDAAAGWGTILGHVFEKFKNLIKANVGPGTGGQLLLDFFSRGAKGMGDLDEASQ
jgi:hypothetical protein